MAHLLCPDIRHSLVSVGRSPSLRNSAQMSQGDLAESTLGDLSAPWPCWRISVAAGVCVRPHKLGLETVKLTRSAPFQAPPGDVAMTSVDSNAKEPRNAFPPAKVSTIASALSASVAVAALCRYYSAQHYPTAWSLHGNSQCVGNRRQLVL